MVPAPRSASAPPWIFRDAEQPAALAEGGAEAVAPQLPLEAQGRGLKQGHDSIPQHTRTLPNFLALYFSEVSGDIHGPLHFAPDEPVEQIQHRLEAETSRSRCVDEETNEWLAHVEISTSCGIVLDLCHNLDEYPVCHGDTLWVFVVPREPGSEDFAYATDADTVRAILCVLQVRHNFLQRKQIADKGHVLTERERAELVQYERSQFNNSPEQQVLQAKDEEKWQQIKAKKHPGNRQHYLRAEERKRWCHHLQRVSGSWLVLCSVFNVAFCCVELSCSPGVSELLKG